MVKEYSHNVKAIQFLGNPEEVKEFLGDIKHYYDELDLIIPDSDHEVIAVETDYIIKEANGKIYIVDETDFKGLYKEHEKCEAVPANDDWKSNRSFSTALDWLKAGDKVARKGWNGKGMYIWLVPEATVPKEWIKDKGLLEAIGEKESMECLGFIRMKTADGKILSGWLASQTDMLADDWELVE